MLENQGFFTLGSVEKAEERKKKQCVKRARRKEYKKQSLFTKDENDKKWKFERVHEKGSLFTKK